MEEAGNSNINGSRDAACAAFDAGLKLNGDVWMEMVNSGNLTTHTYNEEVANEIYQKILNDFHAELVNFRNTTEEKRSGRQGEMFNTKQCLAFNHSP